MSENLARASTILLFGRVVEDVQINAARGSGASAKRSAKSASLGQQGAGRALADQMAAEGSCLARIYAFSYEGHYYDLSKPALFLVHGPGEAVAEDVEHTGLPASCCELAPDIRVWAYDKSDISIRLDPESGMLEHILLEAELNPESRIHYSGQQARLQFSGQQARLQFAGQQARLRGRPGGGDS